mmetsp:Transcript_8768/g.18894  ORF Transcript_8768/g.18894 Transcript_8768/m.18894 type:complete len:208 (-) Transcript_8768:490-1113(-)
MANLFVNNKCVADCILHVLFSISCRICINFLFVWFIGFNLFSSFLLCTCINIMLFFNRLIGVYCILIGLIGFCLISFILLLCTCVLFNNFLLFLNERIRIISLFLWLIGICPLAFLLICTCVLFNFLLFLNGRIGIILLFLWIIGIYFISFLLLHFLLFDHIISMITLLLSIFLFLNGRIRIIFLFLWLIGFNLFFFFTLCSFIISF